MSKIIHLSWNGATDDKGINAYELLYSLAPTFNNWQQAAIINTTQSNVSYDFEVKDYVDHRFSIRTIDTIGQYSDYKYVTQTVGPVPSFISSTSSATIGTCGNPTYTPTNIINIYSNNSLIGNTDVLSGNIVKTEANLTFNGYGRNWNVLHYNKSYNCVINSSGTVTSSISCSEPVTTPVTTPVTVGGASSGVHTVNTGYIKNNTTTTISGATLTITANGVTYVNAIPFSPIAPGEIRNFSTTYTAALRSATYVLTINGATGLSNSNYCYISAGAGSSNGYFSGTTNKTSTMYSDGTQVGLFFQIY